MGKDKSEILKFFRHNVLAISIVVFICFNVFCSSFLNNKIIMKRKGYGHETSIDRSLVFVLVDP